jgi:hypothetical protein
MKQQQPTRREGENMRTLKEVTNEEMNDIASYMNDELRESIHFDLAPCTNEEFIIAYCNADPTFEDLLNEEFHIEL